MNGGTFYLVHNLYFLKYSYLKQGGVLSSSTHHVLCETGDVHRGVIRLPRHQAPQFGMPNHTERNDSVGGVADVIGHCSQTLTCDWSRRAWRGEGGKLSHGRSGWDNWSIRAVSLCTIWSVLTLVFGRSSFWWNWPEGIILENVLCCCSAYGGEDHRHGNSFIDLPDLFVLYIIYIYSKY